MNEFELAATALMALIGPCIWVCARRGLADGLVAAQLSTTLASLALLVISMGEARQPFGDLAIVLAVVSLGGSLVVVRFLGESR